jgi:hypothetical protein
MMWITYQNFGFLFSSFSLSIDFYFIVLSSTFLNLIKSKKIMRNYPLSSSASQFIPVSKNEMKKILAGVMPSDTLPEVIVSSSYKQVYGISYSDWMMFCGNYQNPYSGFGAPLPITGSGGTSASGDSGSIISGIISAIGLGGDANSAVWTSMAKLLQKGSFLETLGTKAGIVGLSAAGYEVYSHFNSHGNGIEDLTADDFVTIVAIVLIAGSMITGVGEVAMGIAGLGFDLVKFWNDNHHG